MSHRIRQAGVTLIELVTVILITGIVFATVAVFLRKPVEGYFDSTRRAAISDIADTAYRRVTRDLRLALPNSVRVSGNHLEFLITSGGGRYRAEPDSGGGGNILDFNAAAGDSAFDAIGSLPAITAGDQLVIFNLGTGFASADAYQAANNNRAAVASVAGSTITLTAPKRFPFQSPGRRFHVVQHAVTYECDLAAGVLRRYWNYGIDAAQATPPTGGSQALLATNVTSCAFTYTANELALRYGVVTLRLSITQEGETVSLFGQAHVPNIP
jgi:MSHA biogenesis protein MshO